MIFIAGLLIYLVAGIVATELYNKRDIAKSIAVDIAIYDCLSTDDTSDTRRASSVIQEVGKRSIEYAGWWFWRRKKPFSRLSMKEQKILGFPLWPIDILMCEIGYRRELAFIKALASDGLKGE